MSELSLFRSGGDLLSHVLRRSTIGVTALNGRVRDGIGCLAVAMTTKPKQRHGVLSPYISVVPSPGCKLLSARKGNKRKLRSNWPPAQLSATSGCDCSRNRQRPQLHRQLAALFQASGFRAASIVQAGYCALLFLDQIKPIEQLVPVS